MVLLPGTGFRAVWPGRAGEWGMPLSGWSPWLSQGVTENGTCKSLGLKMTLLGTVANFRAQVWAPGGGPGHGST